MAKLAVNRILDAEEIRTALTELNSRAEDGEQYKHFAIGYCISNYGNIFNICSGASIVGYENYNNKNGKSQKHKCFEISYKGKDEKVFIHKAVYYLFGKFGKEVIYPFEIMTKKSKYVVHHIDNNPQNNNINNLYLMTRKMHGTLNAELLHKKIQQTDVDTPEKLDQWVILHKDALQWFTDDKNK